MFWLVLALASTVFGQVSERLSLIKVCKNGRCTKYRAIAPTALDDALPEQKVLSSDEERMTVSRGAFFDSFLKDIKLVRLSRYRAESSLKPGPGEKVESGYSHRRFFSAAICSEEIYIFSDDDNADNLAVFNLLLSKLGTSVSNSDEARQLTEFYLFLTESGFNDPAKLIISHVEDIPEKYRAEWQERAAKLASIIHPLRVNNRNDYYQVEFFTWEYLPRGEVIKWQMKIYPSGKLGVAKEVVGLI